MTGHKTTQNSLRPEPVASRRVRDPYADLLRDTRGLKRDQAAARDAWYAGLSLERKEDTLFELEMLLKGLAHWTNTRNHASAGGRDPLYVRNFRPHLAVARAVVLRCVALCTQLLGATRVASPLSRNLPAGFLEEPRGERAEPAETPEASLAALRQSLGVTAEVLSGLLRVEHVPYRLFYAALVGVPRELSRSAFFNPIYALEFRPEFDRVRVPDVLDAILSVDGETAHRLVALTCLGSLRLLRMTSLLASAASDQASLPRAWALLAALRADARALSRVLRHRASSMLADSLERDLMRVPATDVRNRFETVARDCDRVARLRAVLLTAGECLRAESRRLVSVRVPGCDALAAPEEVSAAIVAACAKLRDALQGVIVQITRSLRGSADAERIFSDRGARVAASERLRQTAWLFTVVTRAFVARAKSANTGDVWSAGPDLGFVGDYLAYFRSLGAGLSFETEYARGDRLAEAVLGLRDTDWVDTTRLAAAVTECEAFATHLHEVVERAGQREELRGVALDKGAAGETLKMYLRV